jgi:hypothetical protein
MLGTPGPGSLAQSFATTVNQTYVLNFDLSRNGNSAPAIEVAFNSNPRSTYTSADSGFSHFTTTYKATSELTTLSFFSTGGAGNSGAVLDNVSVMAAVPEPETFAMLLTGLGLIGFVKRRKLVNAAA